jgi:predicted  nucleic acid-binding Zn-ribbon protein
MKYDDNHIRDFEGAKGLCNNCGLVVTLTFDDKVTRVLDAWVVNCPHCGTNIYCIQEQEEAGDK